MRSLARNVARNVARYVRSVSTFSRFFLRETLACLTAQSFEECCEETSEDCCEDSCEECHVWKSILDLFCSGALEGCPERIRDQLKSIERFSD